MSLFPVTTAILNLNSSPLWVVLEFDFGAPVIAMAIEKKRKKSLRW